MNRLLVIAFVLLQIGFSVYEYLHINKTEFTYFTLDSLGVLLLSVLCLLWIPAFAQIKNFKQISTILDK